MEPPWAWGQAHQLCVKADFTLQMGFSRVLDTCMSLRVTTDVMCISNTHTHFFSFPERRSEFLGDPAQGKKGRSRGGEGAVLTAKGWQCS